MTNDLPDGFVLRRPTMNDLVAVVRLVIDLDKAEYGEPNTTEESLHRHWQNLQLEKDTWIIIEQVTQRIVGYSSVWHSGPALMSSAIHVLPLYEEYAIKTYLYQLAEARAREHTMYGAYSSTPITMSKYISDINITQQQFFEHQGYTLVPDSGVSRMQTIMKQAPAQPAWPDGITVHTFVPGQNSTAFYTTAEELLPGASREFREWEQSEIKPSWFDPDLCFLACDGDQIAGLAICNYWQDMGNIFNLAVRSGWRGQGLGMALLMHAFNEFYRRDTTKVILSVEDQNLDSRSLYKRAGMFAVQHGYTYKKILQ